MTRLPNVLQGGNFGRFLMASLLFFCVCAIPAQEAGSFGEIRYIVRPGVRSAGDAGPYEKVVQDSIEVVLQRNDMVPGTSGSETGTVVWEYAILSLVPRLHVALTATDQNHGVVIASATNRARANLTLYNSVDELVEAVLERVNRYYQVAGAPVSGIPPIPIAATVTLPAPPSENDTVVVQPGAPLGEPGDPLLVAAGVTIPGMVTRPRAYGRSFEIAPSRDAVLQPPAGETVPSPEPVRPLSFQIHYSYPRLNGAGVGIRYDLLPDRLYASQETDVHVALPASPEASMVLHLEGRVLAGTTIVGRPEGRFRIEASSGVGGVVTAFGSGEIPPYYDWYWNVFNLGFVGRTGRQSWFLRSGLNYGFETERGFFVDGLNEDHFNPQLFLGTMRSW
jgi:hypothetical protein